MSKWLNVNKELPVIPEGHDGIQVLVIIFDRGGYYRTIYTSYFKKVEYKGCSKKYWFHCTSFNCGTGEESYDLEADEVTDWMYVPNDWKDVDKLRDYIENNNKKEILLKFGNEFHVYPNISVYFALDYHNKKFTHWNYIPDFKYKHSDYMVLDSCRLLLNIFDAYKQYGISEHIEDGTINPIMFELQDIRDWMERYEDWLGLRWLEMSDILDTRHNVESILEAINQEYNNNNYTNIEQILIANHDTIEYIRSLNIDQII